VGKLGTGQEENSKHYKKEKGGWMMVLREQVVGAQLRTQAPVRNVHSFFFLWGLLRGKVHKPGMTRS